MAITRRIFVSLPADSWLPANLNELKWAVVQEIEKLGYVPEIFTNPKGTPALASAMAWSPAGADAVARRCSGAAVIGMPRWSFTDSDGAPVLLPTEFNHYEGALVRTLGLPTLVLAHRQLLRRVVFDPGFGGYIADFDADADLSWLHSTQFTVPFEYWKAQLDERRDVFLGYCGTSSRTAAAIKRYAMSRGTRVLDWRTDFIPGRTILAQIEQAAAHTLGGIFLFTKDDHKSIPRDNVVFEAGYFSAAKGKRNVLIVRENGSKMPADLGGDIYAALRDRHDISPIEGVIESFLRAL